MSTRSLPDGNVRQLLETPGRKTFVGHEITDLFAAFGIDEPSGENAKRNRIRYTFVVEEDR